MNAAKVFVDSDVLLDVILAREPHLYYSRHFLSMAETNLVSGFTSSLIIANCHYITAAATGKETADKAAREIGSFITVLPFTNREIEESLSSGFKDFEDGIQYYIALNNGINTIISRNAKDYSLAAGLTVMSPVEYITEFHSDIGQGDKFK